MKHEIIIVENIKCGGCVKSISKELKQIDSVTDVEINLEEGIVNASGDSKMNRALLVNKLTAMGYPEKGSNSTSLKVKSYMSCAVGKFSS